MGAYEKLANAIIVEAARDYREALQRLSGGRNNSSAEEMKEGCERFFRSAWFKTLTSVDGEMLIRKLNEEVRNL